MSIDLREDAGHNHFLRWVNPDTPAEFYEVIDKRTGKCVGTSLRLDAAVAECAKRVGVQYDTRTTET